MIVILVFVILMFAQLIGDTQDGSKSVDLDDIMKTNVDQDLLTSAFMFLFAYQIQIMVFPTYVDLDKRSTERFGIVVLGYSAF